jgi:hypothetical protein
VSWIILDIMVSANPLTRLAEFALSPFAALRAVRSGRANGLATLFLKGVMELSKVPGDRTRA